MLMMYNEISALNKVTFYKKKNTDDQETICWLFIKQRYKKEKHFVIHTMTLVTLTPVRFPSFISNN
jgi:hypothetical protein